MENSLLITNAVLCTRIQPIRNIENITPTIGQRRRCRRHRFRDTSIPGQKLPLRNAAIIIVGCIIIQISLKVLSNIPHRRDVFPVSTVKTFHNKRIGRGNPRVPDSHTKINTFTTILTFKGGHTNPITVRSHRRKIRPLLRCLCIKMPALQKGDQ